MNASVIATCNEVELVEVAPGALALIDRSSWHSGALVVLAPVVLVFAVVSGVLLSARQVALGLLFGALGGVTVAAAVALWRARQRRRQWSWDQNPILLRLDVAGGWLLTADQRRVAPLGQVRAQRAWQVASSSRALELVWPGGRTVVGRGTPFGQSVDELEAALQQAGVR